MSQALVRLQRKGQMVIPRTLRDEAGVSEGTLLKAAVIDGGRILLTPQLTIDRSAVPGRAKSSRKKVLQELAQTMAELQQEAKQKGLNRMPAREINAAVAAVCRERQGTEKRLNDQGCTRYERPSLRRNLARWAECPSLRV